MEWSLWLLLFISQTALTLAGEYCYISGRYEWCEYGCCGNSYDRYCCGVYSWVIGLCITIGIIVIIAAIVCFLCVYKKKRSHGRVIMPQTQTVTTVTHVNQGAPTYNYGYQQPPPPPYQGVPQPPPYGFAAGSSTTYDSAYPPPPPPKY